MAQRSSNPNADRGEWQQVYPGCGVQSEVEWNQMQVLENVYAVGCVQELKSSFSTVLSVDLACFVGRSIEGLMCS